MPLVERYRTLSPRQKELFHHLAEGATNKEAAAHMEISLRTVEHLCDALKHKLHCMQKQEIIRAAQTLLAIGYLEV